MVKVLFGKELMYILIIHMSLIGLRMNWSNRLYEI